jgi:hypothetical protein
VKKTILLAMLMTLAGKGHAGTDLIDTATVISSTPILERITESRQECDPATAPAQPAQQCRTVQTTREVVKGYTVVYRYNDRDITTTLPRDPGPTVRVGIGVVDSRPATGAPTASMMGSNVRDVSRPAPAPASNAAPAPASNPGGYQYRY